MHSCGEELVLRASSKVTVYNLRHLLRISVEKYHFQWCFNLHSKKIEQRVVPDLVPGELWSDSRALGQALPRGVGLLSSCLHTGRLPSRHRWFSSAPLAAVPEGGREKPVVQAPVLVWLASRGGRSAFHWESWLCPPPISPGTCISVCCRSPGWGGAPAASGHNLPSPTQHPCGDKDTGQCPSFPGLAWHGPDIFTI